MIRSPRTKLSLYFTVVTGVIVAGTLALVYVLISVQFDRLLRRNYLAEWRVADRYIRETAPENFEELKQISSDLGIDFHVIGENGRVLLDSFKNSDETLKQLKKLADASGPDPSWDRWSEGKHSYLALSRSTEAHGQHFTIQIVGTRDDAEELMRKVFVAAANALPFTLGAAFLIGLFFSRRVLDPIEESYARMKRFTADASHELRLPVATMKLALEVPLRRKRTPEEYEQVLKDAMGEAERLEFLIQDLLQLTRLDQGPVVLKRQPTLLRPFLEQILERAKAIRSENAITPVLGAIPDLTISVDPDMLGRAVLNLVDNAVKYNRAGGAVRIEAESTSTGIVIRVSDTGQGIPEQHLPRIFERFYRVDKARSRAAGGAGLGLAIVQSIVDAHDGRLTVESRMGQGSVFSIELNT